MDNFHILDVDSRDERCQTGTGVKVIVKEICGLYHPTDMQKLEKEQRDDLLRQLCLMGVKLRQLSRITGISCGTNNRAKSGPRENRPRDPFHA